ncbi:uncharacterized protein LOC111360849 [Spodoptera litura]|uniref:Uncharacterized protein LOC111360849 n=1 Tax=Spodoptera litura TaxID=69820 RepID=A0A9J7J3A4_SPOLT|nr:uncharacterized protein LOC111360849 [Spodoptera litura]
MPPIKRRRQRKTKVTTKSVLPRRTFATWLDDTVRSIRFAAGTVHTAKTVANTGTSPLSTAHDLLQSAANSLCTAAKSIRSAANLVHASSPSNDPSAKALCARLRLSANWLVSAAAPLRSSPPSIHDALQVAAVALRKAASSLDTGEVESTLRLRASSRRDAAAEPQVSSSEDTPHEQAATTSSGCEQRHHTDQEIQDRKLRIQNDGESDTESNERPREKLTKSEQSEEMLKQEEKTAQNKSQEPIESSSPINKDNKNPEDTEKPAVLEEDKEKVENENNSPETLNIPKELKENIIIIDIELVSEGGETELETKKSNDEASNKDGSNSHIDESEKMEEDTSMEKKEELAIKLEPKNQKPENMEETESDQLERKI